MPVWQHLTLLRFMLLNPSKDLCRFRNLNFRYPNGPKGLTNHSSYFRYSPFLFPTCLYMLLKCRLETLFNFWTPIKKYYIEGDTLYSFWIAAYLLTHSAILSFSSAVSWLIESTKDFLTSLKLYIIFYTVP
jgi:hypothetical protein